MSDIAFVLILLLIIGSGAILASFLTRKKSALDSAQTEAIRDLERRLTDVMLNQLKEIRGNVDGTSKAMHQQISSFTKETVQIRQEMKQVQNVMKEISSFQEIFRSPKVRGQWGEASLEHILSEYFPRELYEPQHLFSSGERVDFALKLPDGKIVPIDAKFSLDNFKRMVEAENDEERAAFRNKFIETAKQMIQNVASKYILPSENTVDFAVIFIPAEAAYYEININKDIDLAEYARSKKVILTSPNTIYLTLRTVEHWFRDTQISRQTEQILKRLARVQQDSQKLAEDFRKLGVHLKNAQSSFDDSEKRISLFSDRVERLLDSSDIKPSLEAPDKQDDNETIEQ